jgi:hypothetical protein
MLVYFAFEIIDLLHDLPIGQREMSQGDNFPDTGGFSRRHRIFYCALRTAHCVLCSVLRTLVPFFILDDMFVSGE